MDCSMRNQSVLSMPRRLLACGFDGKADLFGSIPNGAGEHLDPGSSHGTQPALPIAVPHRALICRRSSRVEARAAACPATGGADRLAQLDGVIVGMMVAKCGFGVPIEILTVNERQGTFHTRFWAHGSHYRRGTK